MRKRVKNIPVCRVLLQALISSVRCKYVARGSDHVNAFDDVIVRLKSFSNSKDLLINSIYKSSSQY